MNEHDESAPRARNTRKMRTLKRPSRWLEKRAGAISSRPTVVPGEPPAPSKRLPATSKPPSPQPSFDDHVADFFRRGDEAPAFAAPDLDDGLDPRRAPAGDAGHANAARTAASARAAAAARRRAYSRHVMVVVALSAALCIAGFVRSATSATGSVAVAPAVATHAPEVAPEVVAPAPSPVPSPAPSSARSSGPSTEPASLPATASEASPARARDAREDARRALDRGAIAAAIDAAKSSVALDPTDADAWLVLGAAYQIAGDAVAAREAFSSCRKLATRGDVGECRAF